MAAEEQRWLESWLNACGQSVLRLCRASLGDAQLAEDALQETFLRVWQHRAKAAAFPEARTRAWIFRIAVNVCRDMKRSAWWRHVDTRVSLDDLPPPAAPSDEEARELLDLIAALPDSLRQPVLLHDLSGLSLTETAEALAISRPTLNRRLVEAYRRLGAAWKGEETE